MLFKVETSTIRLNKAMEDKELDQVDLVRLTGLSKQKISNYVNGKFQPKGDALAYLANALGVDVVWLMGYNVSPDGSPLDNGLDDLTVPEYNHIQRYRTLDDDGKSAVDYILDREYSRIQEAEAEYFKTTAVYDLPAAAGLGNSRLSPTLCVGERNKQKR